MQTIKEYGYTMKVTPEVWNSYEYRPAAINQGRAAVRQAISEAGLKEVADSFKHFVVHTVVVSDHGYSEIPGEVHWDGIAWYLVAFTATGYEPLRVEFKFKDK